MIALRRKNISPYNHCAQIEAEIGKKAISGRKPDRRGTTRKREQDYRIQTVFQKKAESSILSWNAILPAKPLFLTPK